jgi:hypothetical protein
MPMTADVSRAEKAFAACVIEVELVGYFFAVRIVTNDQSVRRMRKQKVFHEFPAGYAFA